MQKLKHPSKWSLVLLAMALVVPITAQEGHPLKGSWIGVWEGNTALGNDVLMILNWDGKAVTGTLNPGTDNIKVEKATLDPAGWKVHLEGDAKDKAGKTLHYVIDGVIGQLEMANRSITGTWTSGTAKGKFEVHRQ
jgi:mRNA-degrading endonuclease YafQ of YafQ-DinJ toxin-antitoxin module